MEPVDVLRPLALGQVALGPGEREIDVGVEGVLCRGHPRQFDAEVRKPRPAAPAGRSGRRSRRRRPEPTLAPDGGRARPPRPSRSRRCFSSSTISSGSPKRSPSFSLTSQKISRRPRRTMMSSSYPATQAFVAEDAVAAQPVPPDRTRSARRPGRQLACAQATRAVAPVCHGSRTELRMPVRRRTEPPAPLPSDNRAPERNGGGCAKARARARSSSGRA